MHRDLDWSGARLRERLGGCLTAFALLSLLAGTIEVRRDLDGSEARLRERLGGCLTGFALCDGRSGPQRRFCEKLLLSCDFLTDSMRGGKGDGTRGWAPNFASTALVGAPAGVGSAAGLEGALVSW